MVKLTKHDLNQIRDALETAASLCLYLDADDRVGEVQRRCLTEDLRTKRNLRYLQRTCARLSRLVDPRPNH
jgi:hypothetical protein